LELARAREAEMCHKESLKILEQAYGSNDFLVAIELQNLAEVYRSTDREDLASELERRAEAILDEQ
jgi:hypothetical protein